MTIEPAAICSGEKVKWGGTHLILVWHCKCAFDKKKKCKFAFCKFCMDGIVKDKEEGEEKGKPKRSARVQLAMDKTKGRGGGAVTESVSAMELDEEEGEECGDHTLGHLFNKRIMSTEASYFGRNQKIKRMWPDTVGGVERSFEGGM